MKLLNGITVADGVYPNYLIHLFFNYLSFCDETSIPLLDMSSLPRLLDTAS